MGISAGLIGLGGSLYGLFGGGGPQQYPGMGQAAQGALTGIENLQQYANVGSSALPYAQSTFQNLYNNPFANQWQTASNTAAGLGQGAALGQYGAGGAFTGAGVGTIPYAQMIMNTGLDPQNALYNRTLQQLQDQVRVGEADRGIATTPYGAGIENQALSNFNIDWQNNLLNRQIQAAGGAGDLLGRGASVAGAGGQMGYGGAQNFASFGGLPYGTYGAIGGGQNQALQNWLALAQGGENLAQPQINDYLNYLQQGNQAQQQQFNQNRIYGNALGGSMYGLGQGWGGGPGNFQGSPFANWGYNQLPFTAPGGSPFSAGFGSGTY
jgi:hypothetical protein